ncbi:MAG: phage portal protein [Pseudomonadales bacterium]|nr:phage portal protein [Pseudomonadales bacterium]
MLLNKLFASETKNATPPPHDDFWYGAAGQESFTDVRVNEDSAMRASAVLACVRVLSETVAMLPLKVYRRLPNGGKEEATNHPLYELLHDQPNNWQTSVEFRETMQSDICLSGNAIAEIIAGPRGAVDRLEHIPYDQLKEVEILENGRLRYTIHTSTGVDKKYMQDDLLHIRALARKGPLGINPVQYSRESVGLSLATEAHGAKLFGNGARPGGVIEYPNKTLTKEQAASLREQWQTAFGGLSNAHRVAVLEDGMKWHTVSMSNDDAQFLETRQFQVKDIARIFRVPPHLIGCLDDATFSNIEQQSLEFIMYIMYPWFKRWEQALKRDLILAKKEYFCEFSFDALLRGDSDARSNLYNSAITTGWLTRNEVRKMENRNPLPGLDEPLQQLNMSPATATEAAYAGVLSDATHRVVSASTRELSRILLKCEGVQDFQDKALQFFEQKHEEYVIKSLTPIVDMINKIESCEISVEAVVAAYKLDLFDNLAVCDTLDEQTAFIEKYKVMGCRYIEMWVNEAKTNEKQSEI